jgi:hypothetical protein
VKPVKYVSEESSMLAREWERRFQALPPHAGVVFVSVGPEPIEGGKCIKFEVRIGLTRRLSQETGVAMVKKVLAFEASTGALTISVVVFRGVVGACRDEDTQGARQVAPEA